ncbi:MAG TPA: nitrogen fixation protein NifQ [Novosphingobium sp.]|nr:nitrogen fixation protein NifQ [Novosphingobium sp.]
MAQGPALYAALVAAGQAAGADPFDCHVAAAILAMAAGEEAGAPAEGCGSGLDAGERAELSALLFGGAALAGPDPCAMPQQEQTLRDILWMNAGSGSRLQRLLARMIARRALRPNHLWQDLGLAHRGELSALMQRHFPRLAARNAADMKWKKFFYRMMCNDAGFALCAAPVCSECDDFDACFGGEEGEALLARLANGRGLPPAALPAPSNGAHA